MYLSVCLSPMVQCANISSFVRELIMEGFAINPSFPVSAFTANSVNTD